MQYKIAIIGFGAGGLASLVSLYNHCNLPLQIDIFQTQNLFATGHAYQHDDNHILLNRHHKDMSIDADDPNSFTTWLSRYHPTLLLQNHGFVSRKIFGEYMQFKFNQIILSQKFTIRCINLEIKDLYQDKESYNLIATNHQQFHCYQSVILAVGHPQQINHYRLTSQNYIHTPYPTKNLKNIPTNATIGIIGTGLSAVDAALALKENHHTGKINLFNRNGLYLKPLATTNFKQNNYFNEEKILANIARHKNKLRYLLALFNLELKAQYSTNIYEVFINHNQSNQDNLQWQNLMYQSGKLFEKCWHLLNTNEQNYFYHHLHKYWQAKRVSMASPNYAKLNVLEKQNEIQFHHGLIHIKQYTKDFDFYCQSKKIKTDFAINATGAPRDVSSIPLVSNLVKNRYTTYHRHGGIDVNYDTGELKNDITCQQNLFAIGHIACGVYLFTSSMSHILDKAHKISHILLNQLLSLKEAA